MNDDQLDKLLCAPLAPVTDGGFAARIVARMRMERVKEKAPLCAALLACAAAALFYGPLPQFTAATLHVVTVLAVLPAIPLAIAALALTFALERALAQR